MAIKNARYIVEVPIPSQDPIGNLQGYQAFDQAGVKFQSH